MTGTIIDTIYMWFCFASPPNHSTTPPFFWAPNESICINVNDSRLRPETLGQKNCLEVGKLLRDILKQLNDIQLMIL